MNKKLLICHNDFDGIGVLILIKYFNINFFDSYLILKYDEQSPDEVRNEKEIDKILNTYKNYDKFYFSDYAPNNLFLNKLTKLNKKIFVYDHHDSSEWLKDTKQDNLVVYHDKTKCGTKIFYENFIKKMNFRVKPIVEYFINLVDIYDLWKVDDILRIESENLNRLVWLMFDWKSEGVLSYLKFINRCVEKLVSFSEWKWYETERQIIEKDIKKELDIFNEAKKTIQIRKDEKGIDFGIVKLSSKISNVASMLLNYFENIQYIIVINTFKEDKIISKVSFRSKNNFNCLQLQFSAGHCQASGGEIPYSYMNDLWDNKIKFIPYI